MFLMLLAFKEYFRQNFGIRLTKRRHQEVPELPIFWHLWSLMMPTFGSHEANLMPKKRPIPFIDFK